MASIKERKLQFANLPLTQALQAVKVGWELETQAVDGMEYDECQAQYEPEPQFDEYRFDSNIQDYTVQVL